MKGLKKLAIASAVAAAPFAQAELVAMDDAVLADMTGQAGVSIELSTQVSIDSFTYTDTDGGASVLYKAAYLNDLATGGNPTSADAAGIAAAGTAGPGSVTMSNIFFGGADAADGVFGGDANDAFDDVKIDIDVDANLGIVMHLGSTIDSDVLAGTDAVDFGLYVGSVTASGVTNPLASNISIQGELGPVDVTINNLSGGDLISVEAYFAVTNGSMDINVIGLGISNLTVGQFDADSPFAAGKYAALSTGTGDDDWAFVAMTIGTGSSSYQNLLGGGATVTVDNALQVSVTSMEIDVSADLTMGSVAGSALSLGSIAINNLDLSGTTMTIYGH